MINVHKMLGKHFLVRVCLRVLLIFFKIPFLLYTLITYYVYNMYILFQIYFKRDKKNSGKAMLSNYFQLY